MSKKVKTIITTSDLHSRKKLMAGEADACISLPGGVGTLDLVLKSGNVITLAPA